MKHGQADVSKPEEVEYMFKTTLDKWSSLDVLVNK